MNRSAYTFQNLNNGKILPLTQSRINVCGLVCLATGLRAVLAYEQVYANDAQLQLFHEHVFPTAFRKNSATSFHEKHLRVEVFS